MIVSSSSRNRAQGYWAKSNRHAYVALAGLLVAGGALSGALAGCGAPAEGETASTDLSPFNPGANGGSGAASSGTNSDGPAPALCIAGKSRCDGANTLETCNGAGTAFQATQCGSGSVCYSGQCQPLNCKAGESLCFGEEIHACNADEKSSTLLRTCNSGSACSPATHDCAPLLCEPLRAACSGNTATRCDATGFALDLSVSTACLGGLSCNAGACRNGEGAPPIQPILPTPGQVTPTPVPSEVQQVAQTCTASQIWCDGNRLNTCNAQGTGFTAQDCGTGTCTATGATATCQTGQVCTPGTTSCEGANTIGTCAADGSGLAVTRCPNGTNCTGDGQCTPVQCNPSGMLSHNGNGGVTVYWFAQGTLAVPPREGQDVNCSFSATRANNDDGGQNDRVAYAQDPALFGAMNFAEYAGAAACGACVQLTQGGRNVTITVADSCNPAINNNGTCTNGHIDLSRSAFQTLTGQSTGDINGITWKYVPCDNVGEVQFLLKKADDQYWNQFLVLNHRYPIVKAEVLMLDGRWVAATREAYNYWLPAEGAGPGGDMGTYRVRVTDINGGIVEEQLELRGGLQGGNGQFECQ